MGTTSEVTPGIAIFSPSTDEITLIAGVTVPSPKNRATPRIPIATRIALARRSFTGSPRTRPTSAMIPPSPWLSARITNATYFTETTRTIVQTTSEIIPYTPAWSGFTPWTANTEVSA